MSAVKLTESGKALAENTQASGPKFAILSLLYESGGPVEVEEVMDAANLDDDKAQMLLRGLLSDGYIKEV